MKYLTLALLILSFSTMAQEKEGDLLQPVTDLSQIERQEEELPPSIEEVEMKQKDEKPQEERKKSTSSDRNQASP